MLPLLKYSKPTSHKSSTSLRNEISSKRWNYDRKYSEQRAINDRNQYRDTITTYIVKVGAVLQRPFTGIAISVGHVSGSLRSGHWKIDNLKLRRKRNKESNFDVAIDNVELKYRREKVNENTNIELLKVNGVQGDFELVSHGTDKKQRGKTAGVYFKQLEVQDVKLNFIDYRSLKAQKKKGTASVEFPQIKLDKLITSNVRSTHLAADLLFQSSAISGSFGEGTFSLDSSIVNSNSARYQKVNWKAQSIPLGTIRHYLVPPLSWIEQAYIDLDTEALHNLDVRDPTNEFKLNLNVLLRDIKPLQEIDDSQLQQQSLVSNAASSLIRNYLGSQPRQLPISVSFSVSADDFDVYTIINKVATEMVKPVIQLGKQKLFEFGNALSDLWPSTPRE